MKNLWSNNLLYKIIYINIYFYYIKTIKNQYKWKFQF